VRGRWKGFMEWIKYLDFKPQAYRNRFYRRGWSIERTFNTPVNPYTFSDKVYRPPKKKTLED
jgi:hypothetical protein